ncbi:MAG: translocation/assembly module TamB domain-containing protein [Bacteroidaceae bacterium]|nr:translocation/assembly module TamB domain-containing protein [Bacteroidaceae bacterium]
MIAKRILKILRSVVVALAILYGTIVLLTGIPVIQRWLTGCARQQLEQLLDTQVDIGHITFGYPNRLILENVDIRDREGNPMLEVARLSAKFEWIPLFREGRISIHTAQVFGCHAHIYRPEEGAEANCQFFLDAFASTDSTNHKTDIDLRINSILVRRGRVCYDVLSAKRSPGIFNANHLAVSGINADISLKSLKADSVNATVKRFEMEEHSGLVLKGMQFRLLAGRERAVLSDFMLKMPTTRLAMDSLVVEFLPTDDSTTTLPLRLRGELGKNSYITLADFAPLAPAMAHFRERLNVGAAFMVTPRKLELSNLHIYTRQRDVALYLTDAYTTISRTEIPYLHSHLKQFKATRTGLEKLYRNLTGQKEVPAEITNLQEVSFVGELDGNFNHIEARGLLETGIGQVQTDATMQLLPDRSMNFSGRVISECLDLKTLLGAEMKLGNVAFALDFNGQSQAGDTPSIYLQGALPTLQYSGYDYQNIHMDGTFDKRGFNGLIELDDPNISLRIDGQANVAQPVPTFNLTAALGHFRPNDLHLTTDREGCEYSLKLRARFSGNNPDNLDGEIDIDSLTAIVPDDFYYMENLHAKAESLGKDGNKRMTVKADFMQAIVEGRYAYRTLPASFMQIIRQYFPSLLPHAHTQTTESRRQREANNFKFDLKFYNSNIYPYVFGIPLRVRPMASLHGYVDDASGKIRIEGHVPSVRYGQSEYESGMLLCENDEQGIKADVRFAKHMSGNARLAMTLAAKGADDRLNTRLTWGNDTEVTYCGSVETETTFSRATANAPYLQAGIRVKPSEIILNDTVWNIRQSDIKVDSGKVHIENLRVEHDGQHLIVDGWLTTDARDSLIVDLNRISVEYILDIVRFKSVRFEGKATGKAYVSGALGKQMAADTKLYVEDFRFNGGLMGNMHVKGRWDNELGVVLDADIREGTHSHTSVEGNISPMANGLDLRIGADRTSLAFLNSFVGGIFANVSGRVSGDVHLHGPFKALNLEGDVLANAKAKVKVLNTTYSLVNDSVHLREDHIHFPNAVFYDPEGHRGVITGRLTHTHLGNMGYNFRINADRLLFYDTTDFGEMPFYGSIYGTGKASLWGGGNALHLDAEIASAPGTLFVYNMSAPEEITDNRFVTFIDKTPRPTIETRRLRLFTLHDEEEKEGDDTPLQVFIDAAIEATQDADVKVIMDTRSGDYVAVKGNGTINVNYTNEGTDLRGSYDIESGVYKMSMQEVIRKDLLIQPGSEVSFTGQGADADLNLKTLYTVNSASLNDLVPDASFNQSTVKVNCLINLTGKLSSPVLSFDLELPTVNDEERQLVRSAISTDEQMRMQILYLLGVGKFYTYDYANTEGRSSSDAMSSILSSTLSGQLNNLLSQAIDMSNWNFSGNFSTGQEGWSDLEVEGILSGRLLNNRLLINGNFGYRENQLSNTNFVGDFNLQWLLTPSGEIRLKAYNQTNDRYFAKTTFNTQGIGLIYKREFDHWRDFFRRKKKQ